MRFRTSSGRWFSAPTHDVLAIAHKVRCWRIAGWRIAQAEDLLAEVDRVGERHPQHIRRVETIRASLVASILSSVISAV